MSGKCEKVVGFFAYASPSEVVCTGDACVISGSEMAMRDYLKEVSVNASLKLPTLAGL
jgi:hypothetical protein